MKGSILGTLYLVSTPIGNLEDITIRALRILREVPLVAAEDTRTTRNLFARHDIHTQLLSYHKVNQRSRTPQLLEHLATADLALVTDAGTPGVADPGADLVAAGLAAGISIIPIPGASAPISALVGSGFASVGFLFLGFLPRKSSDRQRFLSDYAKTRETLIAFEAPHRLRTTLNDILQVLGNRQIVVAREMTKLHEEWVRGDIHHAITRFTETAPRGEITLVIEGLSITEGAFRSSATSSGFVEVDVESLNRDLIRKLKDLMKKGKKPRQAATELSRLTGRSPRFLYGLLIAQNSSASI